MNKKYHQKLIDQINKLKVKVEISDLQNVKVSSVTIGWQIEHSLLTIYNILKIIEKPNPKVYQSSKAFAKLILFTLRWFPRGKVQSPDAVKPIVVKSKTELLELATKTENMVLSSPNFSNEHFFNHPMFGDLKLDQTINFLTIHTNHHLKIIKDIEKK